MKIWIRFGKKNRLRYVSHLDMQRFMHRALNRTNLPFSWSQGFNPHPVMSFGSAIATGWTSEYEIVEIRTDTDIDPAFAATEMANALPPDLPVLAARSVPDTMGAPMALTCAADYEVTVAGENAAAILAQTEAYMAEEHVMAMRKTKSGMKESDIREMTLALRTDSKRGILYARLSLTERTTLKPDVLVRKLAEMAGCEEPAIRVHRVAMLAESEGGLKPLMEL